MQKEIDVPSEYPWRDRDLMEKLYHEEGLSYTQLADLFNCSPGTIGSWMKKHEIETRSRHEGILQRRGNYAKFRTGAKGYERSQASGNPVLIHRLLAVAEYGFDTVCDMQIHHKNGIGWDNRPENIEVMNAKEHRREHAKFKNPDRLAISALYDATDLSSRDVADVFDTTNATVLRLHKEEFGESD